jgi:hypothetical protein
VPQIALNRSGIDAIVGQLVAAGSLACSLHHRLKATVGEWCAALAHEHKGRTTDLALQASERPQCLALGHFARIDT